ncbi:MAG TPA: UPF0182 family protein [Candidatus Obscuribacterales bacterium]
MPSSLSWRQLSKRPFKVNLLKWVAIALFVVLGFDILTFLLAEQFWFQEVEYGQVFRTRVMIQGTLGAVSFILSFWVLTSNLKTARKYSHPAPESDTPNPSAYPGQLTLSGLLPLVLVLGVVIGAALLYHGQLAIDYWNPNLNITAQSTAIPLKFRPDTIWQVEQMLTAMSPWLLGLPLVLTIALLIYPYLLLNAIAVLMSLSFGLILSEHWMKVLPAFAMTPFEQTDPRFQQDLGFYIFRLPVWELIDFWAIGLLSLTVISVLLLYLLSGDSLSRGQFYGFSPRQQRHLWRLVGIWLLAIALSYWLERYELLYSSQGVVYGASFTDINVQLPLYTILSLFAGFMGLGCLLYWALYRPRSPQAPILRSRSVRPSQVVQRSQDANEFVGFRLFTVGLALYGIGAIAIGSIMPLVVQRLVVQPNELALERPYIEDAIAANREAFRLNSIEVEEFNPQGSLTLEDLENNALTVDNIRLWDTRPLLQTNRQLQQFRLYYRFYDADIDRYTLRTPDGGTAQQQVLIAARELDYSAVPADAQTWINEHLFYTHGYGFTISPVNRVVSPGLPDYLIKDIGQVASNASVAASIPTDHPRIYYGELTNTYVMVKTQQQELDYPSGSDNVYNTYDGSGGVSIGQFWQRIIFAKHLRDWRMLLTEDFTPETKLLFRREITARVKAIAPFLRYDQDPYLVVADATQSPVGTLRQQEAATPNYLYWVIDAYTTSDRFPYSDPYTYDFNYIRNSVKVVVDAYNGAVTFFIADEQDPIIQTWSRIFPGMFHPLGEMPATLKSHVRYPQDLFQVQANQLMVYHMTDPQVFYNREDQWRAPSEIYRDESQVIEPYYLLMKLPSEDAEEFILLQPFTPAQRNNLIAWLAARSDGLIGPNTADASYGSMLLYRFPKQELVYGPEQIEARINQDPVISERISLWNRQGSRAIQGNLLVIPIEQSLLYVEPLYLEAEQNELPTLVRVIVAYENRIVMAETLDQALQGIFEDEPRGDSIIRSVEDLPLPLLDSDSTNADDAQGG